LDDGVLTSTAVSFSVSFSVGFLTFEDGSGFMSFSVALVMFWEEVEEVEGVEVGWVVEVGEDEDCDDEEVEDEDWVDEEVEDEDWVVADEG